ncbi:unnamed protein product, partial [Didymodactylos carnosus]
MQCEWQHLQYIFQCASRLKYLNIQLTSSRFFPFRRARLVLPKKVDVISVPTLHTLIIRVDDEDPKMFDILTQWLRAMPFLRCLEVNTHSILADGSAWELVFKTSLQLLSHFSLNINLFHQENIAHRTVLDSFQSPFWIAKKNFRITITVQDEVDNNTEVAIRAHSDSWRQLNWTDSSTYDPTYNPTTIGWWTAPQRSVNDDVHVIHCITTLCLS